MDACQKKRTIDDFNWGPGIFLIAYHLLLLFGLPIYFYFSTPSMGMIFATVVLFILSGISITGGYHRLYSHRSYRTHPTVELFFLFFATLAAQGSVIRWSFDHRLHHAHVDTNQDPYNIKRGFWYAHMLWLFEKPRPIEASVVSDLQKNKWASFQHRYYPWLMLFTTLFVFLLVGWLLNDFLGAFFIATFVRIFALHHCTWFINSLAHTWGSKPFCKEQSAVNNYIISFLTFGEGYHNYHHTYANDYRNGVRWYHFDPTKWTIWTLNKLGLASHLKRMDALTIKKRMLLESKSLMIERMRDLWYVKKEDLETLVSELSEQLLEHISSLSEKYKQTRTSESTESLRKIHSEIKRLKKNLREDWRKWKRLTHTILNMQPIPSFASA